MAVDRTLDNKNMCFPLQFDNRAPTVVAIVAFRNPEDVRACVSALADSTEKNFLTLICDNGGHASYRALVEMLSKLVEFEDVAPKFVDPQIFDACSGLIRPGGQTIRIFCAKQNLGYAGGINLSIGQLGPTEKWSALWILNPDTEPDPNALRALVERARDGHYSLVSSRLVSKSTQRVQCYGSRWRPLMGRGFNIGRGAFRDAIPDIEQVERTMNYASGASLFVTREYIEDVELMDERYFLYCEEVDWCLRRGHHRLGYAHDSLVYHSYGTTIGSNTDDKKRSKLSVYLDNRNGLLLTHRFFRTHFPLVVLTRLLFTFRYLKSGAVGNFFVALSGWFAGLRGREGPPNQYLV